MGGDPMRLVCYEKVLFKSNLQHIGVDYFFDLHFTISPYHS